MPTDTLTSIDNLEQEMADLQAHLRAGIPALALLNDIPAQFADLAAECTALNAASAGATAEAKAQTEQLAAGRAALEGQFTQWLQAADARESAHAAERAAARASLEERFTQLLQEAGAHEAQLQEQWSSFRSAAESEQNQVMRIALTTRQELTDRVEAQEKLVASLDERLATMNNSLANMVKDLDDARRSQGQLARLLALVTLAALGLSAAAAWFAFF